MENNNRLKNIMLSPIGIVGFLILLVLIVLIIISIVNLFNRPQVEEASYEYDPASQTDIMHAPPTNGSDVELPVFIGFTEMMNEGLSGAQFAVMKDAIKKYGEKQGMELTRVSYLHDSFTLSASYVFDFKTVLNIDQTTLRVRADSSKGQGNILGMVVTIWDENDNEVYKYNVNEDNWCDYVSGCEYLEADDDF